MKRKKKMGRPRKSTSEKMSIMVHHRMTRAEYRQLLKKAKSAGLSLSAYLRGLIFGGKT